MDLIECQQQLVVAGVLGGLKFVHYISQADVQLLVHCRQHLQGARLIVLLQKSIVLLLQTVLEFAVSLGEGDETAPQLVFCPFETDKNVKPGQP